VPGSPRRLRRPAVRSGALIGSGGVRFHALQQSIRYVRLTRRVLPFAVGEPGPHRGACQEPEATSNEQAGEEAAETGARDPEENRDVHTVSVEANP
jgi:hypothetical protein